MLVGDNDELCIEHTLRNNRLVKCRDLPRVMRYVLRRFPETSYAYDIFSNARIGMRGKGEICRKNKAEILN